MRSLPSIRKKRDPIASFKELMNSQGYINHNSFLICISDTECTERIRVGLLFREVMVLKTGHIYHKTEYLSVKN